MAKTLQAQMPFPLLLDPEHTLRQHLGIGQLSLGAVFGVRSLVNYGKALGGARNLAVRPSDATKTPAVVIFDAAQNVTWQHVGTALGDYPSIETVVANIPTAG